MTVAQELPRTISGKPDLQGIWQAQTRAAYDLEDHLARHSYFVGERYSIADIALYAYTHVAHEGGFDLARYPAIGKWLGRIASQPNHIRITD